MPSFRRGESTYQSCSHCDNRYLDELEYQQTYPGQLQKDWEAEGSNPCLTEPEED